MMKLKIAKHVADSAEAHALFFVKKAVQFSSVLSEEAELQVAKVLEEMSNGVSEDLDIVEIDGHKTIFVNAAKECGLNSLDLLRMAGYRLGLRAKQKHYKTVKLLLADAADEQFKAILHGLYYSDYSFKKYKSNPKIDFCVTFEIEADARTKDFEKIAAEVAVEQHYIGLCKNLVNTTGSDLNPEAFAKLAIQEAHRVPGLSITILNPRILAKDGFNGLLTVGAGSRFEPCMVKLTYNPKDAVSDKHLALVGKGLTFDTGGISLKPAKGMKEMQSDMSGAAAVLSAICAAAELKIPLKISAYLCLAENRIGSGAVLPGDIFKAKNGKTVMVDNTDAEGRLVLSDGLCAAVENGATHVIDLATLTGAMVRALGPYITGYFTNSDELVDLVKNASANACEKFWQMPLDSEYANELKDYFADLSNIGKSAGAILAAIFLKEFIPDDVKWSHWDIAGTAFTERPWKYTRYGATGIGVQTLLGIMREMSEEKEPSEKDEEA